MLLDYMRMALHTIRNRRLRSWLTILGIVIGVTAVVALISIGQGMQASVKKQFEAIGYDTIIVTSGGAEGMQGTERGMGAFMGGGNNEPVALNLETLKKSPQVTQYGYYRQETALVKSEGMEGQGFLRATGLDTGILEGFSGYLNGFTLTEGRKFKKEDKFVVILGPEVAANLGVEVGDEITMENQSFQVIGLLKGIEEEGGVGPGGGFTFRNMNDGIFVPIEALEALFGGENKASMALVKAAEGAEVGKVAKQVEMILSQQGTPVSTITTEEISEKISGILGTLSMTLTAIAGISLLVGAVGVMNTMYTAVLERTREIGIMKAVGAKDRHVLTMFLIESGLMGITGGVIGVLFGVGVSLVASRFMGGMLPMGGVSSSASISPELIIGALAFSFVLGAISGTMPARQAAKLQPVKALRYE